MDACEEEGAHKYVNHSCNPNSRWVHWTDKYKEGRLIQAVRPLETGDEITVNYASTIIPQSFQCVPSAQRNDPLRSDQWCCACRSILEVDAAAAAAVDNLVTSKERWQLLMRYGAVHGDGSALPKVEVYTLIGTNHTRPSRHIESKTYAPKHDRGHPPGHTCTHPADCLIIATLPIPGQRYWKRLFLEHTEGLCLSAGVKAVVSTSLP
jgi:hypothetical protein